MKEKKRILNFLSDAMTVAAMLIGAYIGTLLQGNLKSLFYIMICMLLISKILIDARKSDIILLTLFVINILVNIIVLTR